MTKYSRSDVELAISKAFAVSQREFIVAQLDRYGVEAWEGERERVQVAIINLSEGDFERLVHFVDRAKEDYLDVLYWSEYPNS